MAGVKLQKIGKGMIFGGFKGYLGDVWGNPFLAKSDEKPRIPKEKPINKTKNNQEQTVNKINKTKTN